MKASLICGAQVASTYMIHVTFNKLTSAQGWRTYFPRILLAASLSVILTVLPQVNNLVETSQLCSPVAQQYRVLGSQMKLLLQEGFSKYNIDRVECLEANYFH